MANEKENSGVRGGGAKFLVNAAMLHMHTVTRL